MKKILFLTMVIGLATLSFASVPHSTYGYFQGDGLNAIVAFEEGNVVPFRFFAKGDYINIEDSEPVMIKVKKTFYVKFNEEEFLFSEDLNDWKQFEEMFTGNISLSISPIADEPMVDMQVEIKSKNDS